MSPVMGKPVSFFSFSFQNPGFKIWPDDHGNDAEQLAYLSSLVCVFGDKITDSVMPL